MPGAPYSVCLASPRCRVLQSHPCCHMCLWALPATGQHSLVCTAPTCPPAPPLMDTGVVPTSGSL